MSKKRSPTKRAAAKSPRRSRTSAIDTFLDEMDIMPVHGLCTACRHPKRKQIESDCRRYAARRASGVTMIPFRTFVLRWIVPQYGIKVRGDGLRSHMEHCCGVKVT